MASTLGGGPSGVGGGLVPLHPEIDTDTPRVARIYNCLLGDDRDSFASEREAAARILAANPRTRNMVRANRRFLGRAVRYAVAEAGIRQVLDIGSGYPTQRNVHEVARDAAPGVRTVYVDNDAVVASHGRAILADDRDTFFVRGDLRQPGEIVFACEPLLDFSRPVALLLVAVLHFIPPEEEPYRLVADLVDALAVGSLLVISHVLDHPSVKEGARVYEKASAPAVPRSEAEIGAFFDRLKLVEPGLVTLPEWRPDLQSVDDAEDLAAGRMPVLCAVGRKAGWRADVVSPV